MPTPEELENLVGTMAATEPQPAPEESSDEDDSSAVAWFTAYTTYRN